MSAESPDHADRALAATLKRGLASRDRAVAPPAFAHFRSHPAAGHSHVAIWRPVFAAAAVIAVIGVLSWSLSNRPSPSVQHGRFDVTLARELSSPDFWRVPTDELLAFAAPPPVVQIPSTPAFQVSLEESVL